MDIIASCENGTVVLRCNRHTRYLASFPDSYPTDKESFLPVGCVPVGWILTASDEHMRTEHIELPDRVA